MVFSILHTEYDSRLEAMSILGTMTIGDYLSLTASAFANKGRISGQREAVTTTTAARIHARMQEDFKRGAILPPVVVGIRVSDKTVSDVQQWSKDQLEAFLSSKELEKYVSIIDGMQRTSVFQELRSGFEKREIRVEVWLVRNTASLTYRMLVLNTGQLPWSLRRQIEVVNSSLIEEIRETISSDAQPLHRLLPDPLKRWVVIYPIDANHRRTSSGEFQAHEVIEMYLSFGLRKAKVDTETVLADQFSRLDMIEAVARPNFVSEFQRVFSSLCMLDIIFGLLRSTKTVGRFSIGRNLFDSLPACIGFFVAASCRVFGRPGAPERSPDAQAKALTSIQSRCVDTVDYLVQKAENGIEEFLDFDTLNAVLAQRGRGGSFERELFTEAFRVFFSDEFSGQSMTECWRAD